MTAYLKLDHIDKHFDRGGTRAEVLKGINLTIDKGEFVSIIGHSGCGKSTLLNLIAGLTPVSSGAVLLENREVNAPGPERAVVFQNHSLLPWLTVYENVNLAVSKVFSRHEEQGRAPRLGHGQSRPRADGACQGQAPIGNLRRHEAARRHRPGARRWSRRSCCSTSPSARSTR